jgi:hypothetical protein
VVRSVVSVFVTISILSYASFAQNQPPASSPQAVTYAVQSIAAMSGLATISDITLTGTATWYGGGTDSGTASLRALGTGESRMDLALTAGTRTEIRDAQTGAQLGQWLAPNNASGNFASQNCSTDAAWFSPLLGSLAEGPNVVLSYIGPQTWNGENVQHIQSYVYQSNPFGLNPSPQQLSTMDFYLDASTLLPAAVTFNAHPDNNSASNLLIEVDFSNYQNVNGAGLMPMHIQRYQQGSLLLDVIVTGASFNSGLPLSIFTIN